MVVVVLSVVVVGNETRADAHRANGAKWWSHPKLQFAGLLGYTGAGVISGHHVKNCLVVGGKEGPSEPLGTRLPVHQDTTTYAPKDSRQDPGLSA
jgi:hypothetical protein